MNFERRYSDCGFGRIGKVWLKRSGSENIHLSSGSNRKERKDDLRGESDGSQPIDTRWMTEESFPTSLRYIGVIRRTHATLLQESRIDDYCNIDCDRNLSEPWTSRSYGMKTTLTDKCGPVSGLQKKLAVARPDHQWPEIWPRMSKAAQRKAAMGYRETQARQCAKIERHLFCWSGC